MRAFLLMSCFSILAAAQPQLSPPTVERAADHLVGGIAPGEIVIVRAPNAGPDVLLGAQLDSLGIVTTELSDTRVWFDGFAAPLAYAANGNVMAVVPYEVAYEITGKKTTEVVVEYQGRRSPPATVNIVPSAPALFTLDSTGKGQAGMLNDTGCCNSPHNPAVRGTVAVLYGTGEGQTNPPGITGSVSFKDRVADYPVPRLPIQVTVGGQRAEIEYAGVAPNAVAGLFQVNFRVPANAPIGDAIPLVVSVGGVRSSSDVTMAVRSQVKRIFVDDPGAVTRDSLQQILTGAGYDVVTARDGRPVDLIVMSLAIPEQERVETVRLLRDAWPQIAVVALATTPAPGPAALRSADIIGAQAVFTTPISSQSVLRRVDDLLRSRPTPYTADEFR
jgi:uncharacterized protein (TIGR03437 family)